ncbi:isoaspartyl peptidase/L-asparaginase family protein [Candidatus Caldatribacterium sp. SIUC1]|uniref:isoaspartyl peptidase/L-asparaginase family protein n=1 Tax=Candidatus Caldatribacterium sp. SIUC1 TaxID=3418365 RepID=UPI003F68C01C
MVIVVHGGICVEEIPDVSEPLYRACISGMETLQNREAVDAVEEAVKVLEDDPRLNAGTGAFPNLLGEVELSASIMKDDFSCGGVAAIKNVRHPISVARAVMERTRHVLLVGEGANLFARLLGFEEYNPVAELTIRTLEKSIAKASQEKDSIYHYYLKRAREKLRRLYLGTVGAVALDRSGRIAAGTSTGGVEMQLPGRVGDSPIIGCGTFAWEWGGVSMTGEGEGIVKLGLARKIAEWMEKVSAQEAVNRGMELAQKFGVVCGAIAVRRDGEVGFGACGGTLTFAYFRKGMGEPYVFPPRS